MATKKKKKGKRKLGDLAIRLPEDSAVARLRARFKIPR
jgi:hypothetical protein